MGVWRSLPIALTIACAPHPPALSAPVRCGADGHPFDANAAPDEALIGRWQLRLYADPGLKAGASTEGDLELTRYPAVFHHQTPIFLQVSDTTGGGAPRTRADLDSIVGWEPHGGTKVYGWSALDLDEVGARTAKSLTSRRRGSPGVLLSGNLLLLGPVPLGYFMDDGFQTWLAIDSLGPHSFWGHWGMFTGPFEPIDPRTGRAASWPSGSFCASRLG